MKYLRYFLISLVALFANSETMACYTPRYAPSEYYMYRVYNPHPESQPYIKGCCPEARRNCAEWQKLTSDSISLEEIYEVVYKMPLAEFESVCKNKTVAYKNKFTEWITKTDTAVCDFLLLAKTNEYVRLKHNSRWYYPTMKVGVRMTLDEIAERALSKRDARLRDRYLLQAVRALFSLSKYHECVEIWDKEISFLPEDNLMRELIKPYIAGAEFHINHREKAIEYFAQSGDILSILYCLGRLDEKISAIEALELVCDYAPNSNYIEETLQSCVRQLEPNGYPFEDKTPDCERLYKLSLKMARSGKSNNPAMWYYTAAFLADLDGNTKRATYLLRLAENSKSTAFISESIKVFRMYLDAKVSVYSTSYEHKLFAQLKWLDTKIKDNIDDKVREETACGYKLSTCESFYYWNDMMRRILLSEVCPRMIAAGKIVRALQLANMADNRLLNLVNMRNIFEWNSGGCYKAKSYTMNSYRYSENDNDFDYRNHFFEMIDSVGVDNVIKYVRRVNSPQDNFDRFLNGRGYTGSDYLNDIIGTQCLRAMRYKDALHYLGKVSEAYKNHHNVSIKYDPFSVEMKVIETKNDFKCDFAREMYSLEQSIDIVSDPDRKARLMVRYAIGVKNSFDLCWGLTQYYMGEKYWFEVYGKCDWTKVSNLKDIFARVEDMIEKACEIVTDDEVGAEIQYQFCNFKTVATRYPDTVKGLLVRGQCDNLVDYHVERVWRW